MAYLTNRFLFVALVLVGRLERAFYTLRASDGYTPDSTNQINRFTWRPFGEEKHSSFLFFWVSLLYQRGVDGSIGFRRRWGGRERPGLDIASEWIAGICSLALPRLGLSPSHTIN